MVQNASEQLSLTNSFSVTPSSAPSSADLIPVCGSQGQAQVVSIRGDTSGFIPGTTQASFGPGVSVGGAAEGAFGSINVTSSTSATAQLIVDPAAAVGLRTVTIQTGSNQLTPASGFFVRTPFQTSSLVSVAPASGLQGQQNLSLVLTGQSTNWAQGATTASFGPGVTVVSLTVNSPTNATTVVNIDPSATPGFQMVVLTTGTEIDSLVNGFNIVAAATPTITTVSPNSGQQGQGGPITVVGQNTHFVQG
jgi:hypothetical protein